jgi:hypothetical protein
MKAHLFMEGGGIVTGTHDKLAAQRAIVDEYLDYHGDYADGWSVLDAVRMFSLCSASLETGRIVPADRATREFEGYTWWWRSGYKLGRRGVTRAVVWNA